MEGPLDECGGAEVMDVKDWVCPRVCLSLSAIYKGTEKQKACLAPAPLFEATFPESPAAIVHPDPILISCQLRKEPPPPLSAQDMP